MKTILRQVTPPIFLSVGKPILQSCKKLFTRETLSDDKASALKAEYDRRNKGTAEDEIIFRENLKLRLHPESRGAFEAFCLFPEVVDEMNCFIEHTRAKHTLLDVGAFHGIFSLVFAMRDPARKVVAVDASPIAFARLLYNINKNSLSNITPLECALSDAYGTLCMHYEWEHAVAAESDMATAKHILMAKKAGDEICEALSFNPDVIKIDVEGHEVKVVKGLAKVIARSRPLIFLELHPGRISEEKDKIEDLISILAASGYQASLVGGGRVSFHEIAKFTQDKRLFLNVIGADGTGFASKSGDSSAVLLRP